MTKPEQIKDEQINLKDLREICQAYIDFNDNDEEYHEDNDYDVYIFETAMVTIFGKEVFNDFINKRQP
jgi:uncharacterized protein YgfB (UPF0149 family)